MPERRTSVSRVPPYLVLPAIGWFLWFLIVPLAIVMVYSVSTKGIYGGVLFRFNSDNYLRATDWIYLRIFVNSLRLAAGTALSCLLLGYPMAYVMATASPRIRSILLVLVVIPFWTNFIIRAYATKLLFGEYGPLNLLLVSSGLVLQPVAFLNSSLSIWFGMVTNYLPFMILPLYVSIEKFDFSLIDAARDLGASVWRIIWSVLIPLTKSGIISGLIFVFTPALGEFVIPDLLGGAKTMLIGNLITEQFLKARDWPFGSALALMLIVSVMVSLYFYVKLEQEKF